jgi:UDP-N-acetyl-D-glucosamine dehydrogenase
MKFTPSVGIGGHCIPVDPYYLLESAEKSQANLPTVAAALHSNSTRAKRIADRIEEVYLNQPGRILIEGITYKSNVKDIRESAALSMALELKSRGHDVRWSDPLFEDEILNLRKASEKDQFDLVILCVTHINTDLKSLNKKASKVVDLTFNKNEESFDFI